MTLHTKSPSAGSMPGGLLFVNF